MGSLSLDLFVYSFFGEKTKSNSNIIQNKMSESDEDEIRVVQIYTCKSNSTDKYHDDSGSIIQINDMHECKKKCIDHHNSEIELKNSFELTHQKASK